MRFIFKPPPGNSEEAFVVELQGQTEAWTLWQSKFSTWEVFQRCLPLSDVSRKATVGAQLPESHPLRAIAVIVEEADHLSSK